MVKSFESFSLKLPTGHPLTAATQEVLEEERYVPEISQEDEYTVFTFQYKVPDEIYVIGIKSAAKVAANGVLLNVPAPGILF